MDGRGTAGGFGSSGRADSCPSCGARCWDGDGCRCSNLLSTLDATRLQPTSWHPKYSTSWWYQHGFEGCLDLESILWMGDGIHFA